MDHNRDMSLFKQVKNDDNNAFRRLFQKYFPPLYIFAKKFLEEEAAKDIVQECFFNLWKNRKKIELTTSLSAYLFVIIKNSCCRQLKELNEKNCRTDGFLLNLKEEECQYYIQSEKSILEFDIRDRAIQVLNKLPDNCHRVFCESRFNGLSNKEIAEKYNISVKGVEKHISKALKLFKEEFRDIINF
ncbi:MAG: RNA polymerase sigma-70 factor [Bacteroidales bacterium]|nr:RNA polymerase sigma-70 factor [Bacteroidales bacterium]